MSGMTTQVGESNVLYLTIAGGNMVQKSTEDNPEAKKREYEKKDGTPAVKYEIHHRNLTGRVSGLEFKDSDFGEQFVLTLSAGGEKAKLTVGVDSNYFTDFAKRFPGIDLTNDITINPYDMEKDNGRKNRGISVKQGETKIMNAYWDGTKVLNGFPEVDREEAKDYDKDDWKMFFIKVKKFLKKNMEAVVLPAPTESFDMSSDIVEHPEMVEAKATPKKKKTKKKAEENSDLPF